MTLRLKAACHPECFTRYDSTLGWANAPNSSGRHRNAVMGFDVTYRIGPLGFRDSLTPLSRPPGGRRIVVLGDSNGFGWGVAERRHFSALVEESMRGVQVLNMSVSGYGTDQEYLLLRSVGPSFEPDLVILQVTPDDLDDIQRSFVGSRPKPHFTAEANGTFALRTVTDTEAGRAPQLIGSPLPSGVRTWLSRHSYTYTWASNTRMPGPAAATTDVASDGSRRINLFRCLVNEIGVTCRNMGARLLVVHASNEIQALGAGAFPPGTEILDVSAAFASAANTMYADGLHWNELGHRVVADHHARWLTASTATSRQ